MKTKQTLNKTTTWALCIALPAVSILTTGCANTADGRRTQAEGTGIGALAGGALGYMVGGGRGAAIGALVGGGIGMAYGTSVANRKAKYARAEQWLEQETLIARQANAKAYAYNKSLRNRIASLEQRVKAARMSGNKVMLSSLKSEISHITRETNQFNSQQVQAAEDVKQVMGDAQARAAGNFGSFQKEADAFNEATAERGRLIGRLASLRDSIDR